ncbi:MAG: hypothetical protein BV456_01045 [Thermoplasmata archaeon M8B2D]|nr:MAG: hypothetical protein BV456_01045 [Thermoplasmata archaeon M8B2D]
MNHTIYENILKSQLLTPALYTTSQNVNSLDHKGYKTNSHMINVGIDATLSGVNNWTFKLQESDDNSVWNDVTDLECLSIVNNGILQSGVSNVVIDDPTEDDAIVEFEYRGLKRYSRIVATVAGTVNTPLSITGLQERADIAPVVGRSA